MLSQRVKPRSQHVNIKHNKKTKNLRHYKSTFSSLPRPCSHIGLHPSISDKKLSKLGIRWAPKPLNIIIHHSTLSSLQFSKLLHFEPNIANTHQHQRYQNEIRWSHRGPHVQLLEECSHCWNCWQTFLFWNPPTPALAMAWDHLWCGPWLFPIYAPIASIATAFRLPSLKTLRGTTSILLRNCRTHPALGPPNAPNAPLQLMCWGCHLQCDPVFRSPSRPANLFKGSQPFSFWWIINTAWWFHQHEVSGD